MKQEMERNQYHKLDQQFLNQMSKNERNIQKSVIIGLGKRIKPDGGLTDEKMR